MDALSHYHLSQEYAAKADQSLEHYSADVHLAEASAFAAVAQVHATLALAGVTALNDADGGMPLDDHRRWKDVASVGAPIPPETDDDAVRVGSVSPTEPVELGEWLRALPWRTILRDRDWSPCHRRKGVEHVHRGPNRLFDALYVLGDPFEIAEGHEDLRDLSAFAPFTVLALGDGTQGGA